MAHPDEQVELLVPPRPGGGPPKRRVKALAVVLAAVAVAVVAAVAVRAGLDGSAAANHPDPRGFHLRDGVVVVDDARPRTVVVELEAPTARPQGVVMRSRLDDEDVADGGLAQVSASAVVRGVTGLHSHCRGRPDLHWVLTLAPRGEVASGRCDRPRRLLSRDALEAYYWWPPILPLADAPAERRESVRLFLTAQDPGAYVACLRRRGPDCGQLEPPAVAARGADFGTTLWEAPPDPVGVRMLGVAVATVTRSGGVVHRLVEAVAARDGARRLVRTLPPSDHERLLQVVDASGGYDEPALAVDGRRVRQGGSLGPGPSVVVPAGGSRRVTVSARTEAAGLGFVVFEREP